MSNPSKLTRALALAALLAAMGLAGATAAQAHATARATGHGAGRPPGERSVTSQRQPAGNRPLRILLARERFSMPDVSDEAPARMVVVPMRPAEPSGQPGWLVPALSALAAVLALVAGVAVTAARRAIRGQRAGQAA